MFNVWLWLRQTPAAAGYAREQPATGATTAAARVGPELCRTLLDGSSPGCRACRYEAAAFFADKLVTLSGYAPAEVYTLAQVCGVSPFEMGVHAAAYIHLECCCMQPAGFQCCTVKHACCGRPHSCCPSLQLRAQLASVRK